ncbi:MAG: UTP--glucose-1-phosphate uridylyltransferase GalU [Thermoplasmata archaeon]|nr:UTP--glucose-1-phosphate uridylyltransferase GalU [Candidatus Sysuiplasma acidicola]MBX8645170.1 UTP--glucose-1-phosphate uridylyltransferase GalU [Candidatus Sysuiplasma acidicola]
MKAIIPAAGMGTRFLPLTKVQPKEMLPVVDKPVIQYVVEEAVSAGIEDIIIVTGREKRAIEDHFDASPELERILEERGNGDALDSIRRITSLAHLHYIRQKAPKGLGDAVYCARHHIGEESFAVMLGDTINISGVPVVKQLMNAHRKLGASVIAVEHVPYEKIRDYGIIKGTLKDRRTVEIQKLVEKPNPSSAPSDMGITGTYVLTPAIFDALEHTEPDANGEIQLTNALELLGKKEKIYGYLFDGTRYDIGDMLLWMKVNIELTLRSKKYGGRLRKYFGGA